MRLIVILFLAAAFFTSGCSSLKTLSVSSNKQTPVQQKNTEVKFLDDISMSIDKTVVTQDKTVIPSSKKSVKQPLAGANAPEVEKASETQIKYAILLNTEVEEVRDTILYKYLDQWYGTRYCMGGTSKHCVDCSAFTQAFYAGVYNVGIARTAREQYRTSKRISRTEIKEGDLLFFNTTGGISHVGVYLQNNKFAHASSSQGVMISDMFETYWVKKLVGVGRIEKNGIAGK